MTDNTARFKVTMRCQHTGGVFNVWVNDESEAPVAAERLQATVEAVTPSNQAELDLQQLLVMCGALPQLRFDQ